MGCRGKDEKAALVRIVFDGSAYAVDARGSAPGRGAYLHPGCAERAGNSRAIPRALRVRRGGADELAELLARLGAPAAWPNRRCTP